jgi:hypothetical protein
MYVCLCDCIVMLELIWHGECLDVAICSRRMKIYRVTLYHNIIMMCACIAIPHYFRK